MSLTLKSIVLENIRSHENIVFEPNKTGITAISGANGSGKSTLVDSIAWVLYGTKPHGVTKSIQMKRDQADLKQDKCSATIIIELDNTEIKIERRIVSQKGTVECNVWELKNNEWEHISGPSVSHSEAFILKRLKMDEAGFLAAVLVQQKQVDQLIASPPKERAAVIEHLTGIDTISHALSLARSENNTVKKLVQHATVDEDEYYNLVDEEEKTRAEHSKWAQKTIELTTQYETHKTTTNTLRNELSVAEDIDNKTRNAKENITRINSRTETLQEELDRVTIEKNNKKKTLPNPQQLQDANEIETKINNFKQSLRKAQSEHDNNAKQKTLLQETLDNNQKIISKAKTTDLTQLNTQKQALIDKQEALCTSVTQLEEHLIALQAYNKSLSSAHNVINNGTGTCPTCLQTVSDVQTTLDALTNDINENEEQQEKTKEQIEKTKNALSTNKENTEKYEYLINIITESSTQKEQLNQLENSIKEQEQHIKEQEIELKILEKTFSNLQHSVDIQKEYDNLLQRIITLTQEIEKLEHDRSQYEQVIEESSQTKQRKLTTIRKELETSVNKQEAIQEDYNKANEQSLILNERLNGLVLRTQKAKEELENYKTLMATSSTVTASVNVIEEFRETRISTAIPMVSAYASNLLTKFTDGQFTQLALDKKFNTTVSLANGQSRPVGLLSGGELSSAAIALRIAVSLMMGAGDSNRLLILDEAFVSQDKERAEQILNGLKEIYPGQLILISHGPGTTAVADEVFEMSNK